MGYVTSINSFDNTKIHHVIHKGVKHYPIATQSSVVLMFENSKLEGKRS